MAHAAASTLLDYLPRIHDPSAADTTDYELLRRYVLCRDETAFAALLHHHAPLVWRVCRRLLANEQDAEDAFQAAFLVLPCKANALEVTDSLAPWLHAVAMRIARKARVMALRRRCREKQAEMPTASDPFAEVEQRDLPALLDEELLVDAEFVRMQAPFGDTVRPSPRASLV